MITWANTVVFVANRVVFEGKYCSLWGRYNGFVANLWYFGKIGMCFSKYSCIWGKYIDFWENTANMVIFCANIVIF